LASEILLVTSHVDYQNSLTMAEDKFLPSDIMQQKTNYAKISAVNKIDN